MREFFVILIHCMLNKLIFLGRSTVINNRLSLEQALVSEVPNLLHLEPIQPRQEILTAFTEEETEIIYQWSDGTWHLRVQDLSNEGSSSFIYLTHGVYLEGVTQHWRMEKFGYTYGYQKIGLHSSNSKVMHEKVTHAVGILRAIFATKGHGGWNENKMRREYGSYRLSFLSSRGSKEHETGARHGLRFYSHVIGPFPIATLFDGDNLAQDIEIRLAKAILLEVQDPSDEPDEELPDDFNAEDALDEVVVRFLPNQDDSDSDTELEDPEGVQGCAPSNKDRLERSLFRMSGIWNPPDSDNDCFLLCLAQSTNTEPTPGHLSRMRFISGKLEGQHQDYASIQKICDHMGNDIFYFYTIKKTIQDYGMKDPRGSDTMAMQSHHIQLSHFIYSKETANLNQQRQEHHFLTHKQHTHLLTNSKQILNKRKCDTCNNWINNATFGAHSLSCHYCKVCRFAYSTRPTPKKPNPTHDCRGARLMPHEKKARNIRLSNPDHQDDWVPMYVGPNPKKMTNPDKIWLCDIEAFPSIGHRENFIPYAIGIQKLSSEKKVKLFYGETCMADFLEFCKTIEGTVKFYNGARFDNYLVLKGMLDLGHHVDPSSIMKQGSALISFNIHKKLKVTDLCQYIKGKLVSACKSWGVPQDLSKKDFDHSKVYDWASVEQHRTEVEDYLTYDCISLRTLYHIYSKEMWECFKIDINNAVSLSHFGLKAWVSTISPSLLEQIYVPHAGREEDDDRAAYYGGRVMAQRKHYKSAQFDENADHYSYNDIKDWCVIADVNSLYPTVQEMFEYAHGPWRYWPTDEIVAAGQDLLDRINLPDRTWLTRVCLQVSITPPKDLITPFLFERTKDGLKQNLNEKRAQWYWGCEIAEAVLLGYKVTDVQEVKEFEKVSDLFSKFIAKCWYGTCSLARRAPDE